MDNNAFALERSVASLQRQASRGRSMSRTLSPASFRRSRFVPGVPTWSGTDPKTRQRTPSMRCASTSVADTESPPSSPARELEARAFKCLRTEAVRGRALVDFAAAAHEVEQEARFAVALGTRARSALHGLGDAPFLGVYERLRARQVRILEREGFMKARRDRQLPLGALHESPHRLQGDLSGSRDGH